MTPPITPRQRRWVVDERDFFRWNFTRQLKRGSDRPFHPNWARLINLKRLKRLEIGHLSPFCAYDLADVINNLSNLEKLLIVMAPNDAQPEESGVNRFLERAIRSKGITRLKSLTLSDPKSRYAKIPSTVKAARRFLMFENLVIRSLYLTRGK